MAKETQKGRYVLRNPEKYIGNPTNVIFRSSWEKRFMIFLDNHESILSWSSEELAIPYFWDLDKKIHYYFPDFIVTMKTKQGIVKMIIEIKPYSQTVAPIKTKRKSEKTFLMEMEVYSKNIAKWKAAEKYCSERNMVFRIITEKDLFKKVVW